MLYKDRFSFLNLLQDDSTSNAYRLSIYYAFCRHPEELPFTIWNAGDDFEVVFPKACGLDAEIITQLEEFVGIYDTEFEFENPETHEICRLLPLSESEINRLIENYSKE